MNAAWPHIPEVERLSARVIRILGGNPGKFTLQGTNTYLIGQGPRRILIDSAQGIPSWIHALKNVLASENATIERAIITHWHPDHVGGIPDLLALSPTTLIHKYDPNEGQEDIRDGQKFSVQGATLRAFHCPGHTTDHMALVLEEEDAMFTGDNVLGNGTSVFEDLAVYMGSLDRMATQFKGRGYPAHGTLIDNGPQRIAEYIAHRQERENQILGLLASDKTAVGMEPGHGWTSKELVQVIYRDLVEHMHQAAERGVLQVLEKLQSEGRVAHEESTNEYSLTGYPR
ncbi:Metallo-hydrolase/oxidoreductase [Eremomyces bilateralis CBS 781.70]|uniref:Metallo-hydrolase/oxidoreductase n=1 Tax=Eremomyces bilateralis CBS 781.70 TaxID=1392243 RepID=A0A6G1GHW1_9PEZI|nr:Metallo-hydrolase/oxidoreductase [Eremomyces bilateralis CBS 781.70]KAF1817668.1 Metallo-hydrolase/oxidoreductase [Eremomyces bilateralis CBS 781.70]